MNELPVEPFLGGFLWTWVIPTVVFLISAGAAAGLYLHFSRQGSGGDSAEPSGDNSPRTPH